jgi:Tc5 transposase DNA-binding domain/Fission yeast centromere protein N-terminal domain
MPPVPTKTRCRISDKQKKEICELAKKNPSYKQQEIAREFMEQYPDLKIDRSTVSKILKNADKYEFCDDTHAEKTFRHRSVKYPMLERAMNMWISQVTTEGMIISDSIVKEKGHQFAQALAIPDESITFSNGWTTKFKQRNGLKKIIMHGEAASAPLENLPEERRKLQELLSNYNPEDIYNADETGLFYRLLPNQTLSTKPMAGKKKVS